jgi:tetratricopeptide (TPR) repeat protein
VRPADLVRAGGRPDSAAARFRAALGPEHVEVAATLIIRARLAEWDGAEDAEPLLASALAALERHARAEPRDPRLAEALTQHAALLQARGRYDEAEQDLDRAEALTRELYGDELTSELLRRRGAIAAARGEPRRAEELSRRALAFELSRWAATRPAERAEIDAVSRALVPGAGGAGAAGAAPPYVAAFRLLRRFRGDGAFELASWMNALAELLEPERASEREALLREALEIRCRAYGVQCPVRQRTLLALGALLTAGERAAEAVPLLRESLAIATANGAERDAAAVRVALAACCAAEDERP